MKQEERRVVHLDLQGLFIDELNRFDVKVVTFETMGDHA